MKLILPAVEERGVKTQLIMAQVAPVWTSTTVVSPNNFFNMIQAFQDQQDVVSGREADLAVAAGQWDMILDPWHDKQVLTLRMARVKFAGTANEPAWRPLKAAGQGRERILKEGRAIESAWRATDPTWVPKQGLTLASVEGIRKAAEAKQTAFGLASKEADVQRGLLQVQALAIHRVNVSWYEEATAQFRPGTAEGELVRTIPTSYNPNRPPGPLRFSVHMAPAPNQSKLVWTAARGEKFDIYAKAPGSNVWDKILDGVTQTQWMGEGLSVGEWAFKGVATNAFGTGEVSKEVTVPVSSAMAA